DGVEGAQPLELVIGERLARLVPAAGAGLELLRVDHGVRAGGRDRAGEDLEAFGDDFRADAVAGHHSDVERGHGVTLARGSQHSTAHLDLRDPRAGCATGAEVSLCGPRHSVTREPSPATPPGP